MADREAPADLRRCLLGKTRRRTQLTHRSASARVDADTDVLPTVRP
jgi:hypothetical protein